MKENASKGLGTFVVQKKQTNYCTDKYQTAKLAKLNCFATKQ